MKPIHRVIEKYCGQVSTGGTQPLSGKYKLRFNKMVHNIKVDLYGRSEFVIFFLFKCQWFEILPCHLQIRYKRRKNV